jgi:hypothetical protein
MILTVFVIRVLFYSQGRGFSTKFGWDWCKIRFFWVYFVKKIRPVGRIVQNGGKCTRNAILGLDSDVVCCYCVDDLCRRFFSCGTINSPVKPCE